MARTETILINVDTSKAQQDIDDLKKSIQGVGESASGGLDDTSKSIDKVGDSGKKASKDVGGIGGAFKSVGSSIKGVLGPTAIILGAFVHLVLQNPESMLP